MAPDCALFANRISGSSSGIDDSTGFCPRRLIVNADDFGRSSSINEAVIKAHRGGILTTASLMVNEPGFKEAVELARENPHLGVGLHVSFLCGLSALGHTQIPGLVDKEGQFSNKPGITGFRCFFDKRLREQLEAEVVAQLEKFRATGLVLDHVNGHLHFHLHPTILRILLKQRSQFGIDRVRLTFDPLGLNLRLARGNYLYRVNHALIFGLLAKRARRIFAGAGVRHTSRVFGLLQNGRVDEAYILRLLAHLPAGDSELYSHPSLDEFKNEFDALVSTKVRESMQRFGIKLIRYQDL
jgi:hopanoid biosynthesis associated protein HpnK